MNFPALSISIGAAPADSPVHALFKDWADRAPSAPVLFDGARSWTYGELDRLADRMASALRDQVGPGDLVGVCLDRSATLVTVALAVARLGAVYLPFGSDPGKRRLAEAVRSLGARCLIGDPGGTAPGYRAAGVLPAVVPEAAARWFAAAGAPPTAAEAVPGTPHYAILTSGSTGVPKAVAVGGESLGTLLHWYRELTSLGPGDRHSYLMAVGFDAHMLEMWAVLTSGAALSAAPLDVRWSPKALTDWWRGASISVCFLPTPLAEPVLDRPWPAGLALRHLSIGGDRLRRWPAADVTAQVHNAYGPAEATVVTTVHSMTPGAAAGVVGYPPIGRPVPGAAVLVTGPDGTLVPRGEPGELRIGGRCLALGYFDGELSAQRFAVMPPGGPYAGRVYRTGDRVLMRPDGELEFLGRLDDQVKISGVRIEVAEVEGAFERAPEVRRAVVAVRPGADGGAQLVAFVQPAAGSPELTPAELRAHARQWLPEQAVPALVKLTSAFPVTSNDKIDKAALLASLAAEKASTAEHAAASGDASPVELDVLRLCREILGDPEIGLQDNFLEVGGNSLGGARLLAALEERYGVRLRAHQLLRQPDLRHIALLVTPEAARVAPSA